MLRNKPHLGFSLLTVGSGLVAFSSKFIFTAKSYENPILYWIDVFLDGIPLLFVSFLFLAIAYWIMAFFERETYPLLNVLQLVFVLISFLGIRYVAGSIFSSSSVIPDFTMLDYLIIISPNLSIIILVLNIIYSLVKTTESIKTTYKF